METEFVYWKHLIPAGIRVEEISGGEDKSAHVWRLMALQIYGENGEDEYRRIGHFENGAPFLCGETSRISISHSGHLLVVATLPRTPEAALSEFSTRTALGIDTERSDREQVLKVRERFLNPAEMAMIPSDDIEANVRAWTAKEALYKAALTPGIDFRDNLRILELQPFAAPVALREQPPQPVGKGQIVMPEGVTIEMELYSYRSEQYCVTVAYSPKCAKFSVPKPR